MVTPAPARLERLPPEIYAKMLRYAESLARNRCDAEDLAQEAVLRACRAIADFEGGRPLENWMMRILTRIYLDDRRRRRRRPQTVSSDAPARLDSAVGHDFASDWEGSDPERTLLSSCLGERMSNALGGLSPTERELVWMADVEQMKYREIADQIGIPVGTVRSRLHRAHRRLRDAYRAAAPADA